MNELYWNRNNEPLVYLYIYVQIVYLYINVHNVQIVYLYINVQIVYLYNNVGLHNVQIVICTLMYIIYK